MNAFYYHVCFVIVINPVYDINSRGLWFQGAYLKYIISCLYMYDKPKGCLFSTSALTLEKEYTTSFVICRKIFQQNIDINENYDNMIGKYVHKTYIRHLLYFLFCPCMYILPPLKKARPRD